MRFFRAILLLSMLGAAGWLVHREQEAGRLRQVDEAFLDFLVANSRGRFESPGAWAEHPVVKVVFDGNDAAEFEGWPPQPLDWQMLLEGLQAFAPDVVAVTTPLGWGQPPPDFIPAVEKALRPFPSVVLAAEGVLDERDDTADTKAFLGDLDSTLPRFPRVTGLPSLAPRLSAIITPPEAPLRRSAETGVTFSVTEDGDAIGVPAAFRSGNEILPTLFAQTLARQTRTPYSQSRLRLGPGAGLHLDGGLFVPLAADGTLAPNAGPEVPEINAMNLVTVAFADVLSAADKKALGSGKVVVAGVRPADQASAEVDRLADALALALAGPRIRVLPEPARWAVWTFSGALSFWLVFFAWRRTALRSGLILLFLTFAASYVAFQSSLWWCPPSMPLALIVTGILCAMIAGRRPVRPVPGTKPDAPVEKEA